MPPTTTAQTSSIWERKAGERPAADSGVVDFAFDDDSADAADEEENAFADAFDSPTSEMPTVETLAAESTAEMPTVETPIEASGDTAEAPTVEQPFADAEAGDDGGATAEAPQLADSDATTVAGLDEARTADATAEIDLDDLGLDLDAMQSSLNDDLADDAEDALGDEDTSRSAALDLDVDDPDSTGRNQALGDADATGTNEAIDSSATGVHSAFDLDQTLSRDRRTSGVGRR